MAITNVVSGRAVSKGENLVKAIMNPHEILTVDHIEGAKYKDVVEGMKENIPSLAFLKGIGVVKVNELPSGNKVVKINTERWRGQEKAPVDSYKHIQMYFNEAGDCLQLTSAENACWNVSGATMRTAAGKKHLQKAGVKDPKTYDAGFNSAYNRFYRSQCDEHLPYGTGNTLEYPNWYSQDCISSEYKVTPGFINGRDGKLIRVAKEIERVR